jgi:hypothetical protein
MVERPFVLFLQPVVLDRLVEMEVRRLFVVRAVGSAGMISVVRVVRGLRMERMRLGISALGRGANGKDRKGIYYRSHRYLRGRV